MEDIDPSSNYRTQVSLGSDLWVRFSETDSLSEEPCCRLNLSDEDTNSILTDNANRAIQGNMGMQVTQPGGQLSKQCKWRYLMTKFWTNASCATWWPNMQLIQVAPSGGQICNQCKWRHLVAKLSTNACGAIWWPNCQLMQVAPSGGEIFN